MEEIVTRAVELGAERAEMESPSKKKQIIKAFIFLSFVITAFFVFRLSSLSDVLTMDNLRNVIHSAGRGGPILFIIAYSAGICFFIPASFFAATGGVLFGPLYGFVYNEIGALIGASIAFFIARYFGRDFAASHLGNRLKKYDDKIEEKGFATVLYLRLVFFPFTPMNFGMGLTKIKFKDYFFGTLLGIIASGFILTFFFATLSEVIISKNWSELLSFKVSFSIALFVFSFFIPKIVKRFKAEA